MICPGDEGLHETTTRAFSEANLAELAWKEPEGLNRFVLLKYLFSSSFADMLKRLCNFSFTVTNTATIFTIA